MKPLQLFRKGKFNDLEQVRHNDGTVTLNFHDRKGKKYFTVRVKDLYGKNEREVDLETGEELVK